MKKIPNKRKVVVVTGASAGVGRATVRRFAQEGTSVGLIARGIDGLEGARKDVEAAGGHALVCPCDVADAQALEQAAERIEQSLGPIDIWINAAFAGVLSPFAEMSLEDFERVTRVTYLGQVHGTFAALRRMMPRNRGSIVLVGSALAYRGIPLQSAYCGAKHAIQGFHDSVRSELIHAGSKVRMSMVQLPGINTPQFDWIRTSMPMRPKPASPPYQPEIAAEAIHFASTSGRKEVRLGWPTLQAIWGDRLASPLMDRYLARTAIDGQQTDQPVSPDRKDNLYEPVKGDHGAHGSFGEKARKSSSQLWITKNRLPLAIGGGIMALAAAVAGLWRPR
ncbi:SDR family oxidoreductase [Aurantiacibacter zhengii]|jgi:NAD(P)-dependent dehydrogenase (short-subunit alcohol dehydrogenase family)|uniref:SDR family NAD(P)-dependent oxidoreductase n=1 Tax=Aurantiacibacter zhengii TaxID=2307003 RepID=A0A418NPS8_9SPHN|nr:SDR family oxidoreductase [Aurantiacibacter zhengii]RIV84213.1 SDR family NAD(P)-dependent oxidoreductase [Aurantiacibacter zhengii]